MAQKYKNQRTDLILSRHLLKRTLVVLVSFLSVALPLSHTSAQESLSRFFPVFIFSNDPLETQPWSEQLAEEMASEVAVDNITSTLSIEDRPDELDLLPEPEEIRQINNIILQLEDSGGPYNFELEQLLFQLGDLYLENGQTDLAIEAFEKSFHINRINLGLYNEKQFALLDKITMTQLNNFNLSGAVRSQQYVQHLEERLLSGSKKEDLLANLEHNNWVLNLVIYSHQYNLSVEGKYLFYIDLLAQLEQNYSDILKTVKKNFPERTDVELDVYLQIARTNYYLGYFIAREARSILTFRNEFLTRLGELDEKYERQIRMSYSDGKNALISRLEKITQMTPDDTKAIVLATLDLADWYEAFQNNFDSTDYYETAFNMLADSDIPEKDELLKEYFQPDRPIPIPVFIAHSRTYSGLKLDQDIPLYEAGYINASFEIGKYGHASRVSFVDSNLTANLDFYYGRLRTNITSSRLYRPFLEEPRLRARREVSLKYYIYGVGDYRNAFTRAVHGSQ